MKNEKKQWGSLLFLGFVLILYLILFFVSPAKTVNALKASGDIFIKLIPALLLVIFLMGILNYFLKPKSVAKYLGEDSGYKGWAIAILSGILSHGPIYAWYPLLKELQKQGMKIGLVAVFLYNRAIKIPLLPVMIVFFGLKLTIALVIGTIFASLIEGNTIELLKDFIS